MVPVATTTALRARTSVAADVDACARRRARARPRKSSIPRVVEPRELAGVVAVVDHLVAAVEHDGRVELAGDAARATPGTRSTSASSSPGRSSAFEGMQA